MIKFFRQIRQAMIKDPSESTHSREAGNPTSVKTTAGSRVSKYLLYAIGEIVLVVIGILIALQVNDWNEGRKNHTLVDNYRIEFIKDMEFDRNHFQYHLTLAQEENQRIDSIRHILNAPNANQDTLASVIRNVSQFFSLAPYVMLATSESPQLNDNTYLSLKSSGQIALLDDDFQSSLTSFYGYHGKYAFMIEEIIKNKNASYNDFITCIPFDPRPESSLVNKYLMNKIWENVDMNLVEIKYVSLMNTYYELNLKNIFFNEMRLNKTHIMIDELKAKGREVETSTDS